MYSTNGGSHTRVRLIRLAIRDDDSCVCNVWSVTFGFCINSGCKKVKSRDDGRRSSGVRKVVDCTEERSLICVTETKVNSLHTLLVLRMKVDVTV